MFGIKKTVATTPSSVVSQTVGTPKPLERKRVNRVWQKRIPTLAGLAVLIVAMIAGVLLFGDGTGVFSPRATPQTTPKNIKITNVTDTSFTVSFITDETTPAFLKYGTTATALNSQAGDERDQITGTVQPYNTHHITLRGLSPNTTYYFTLGTGSSSTFTNNGEPFLVKTALQAGTQPVAKTVYGSVTTETGAPAEGALVYVKHPSAGELSSLVKNSGSWAVYLSNARTPDGSGYAATADEDTILVSVQGPAQTQTASITTTVALAQPVETISYGQTSAQATTLDTTTVLTATEEIVATQSATTETEFETTADFETEEEMTEVMEETVAVTIVDLEEAKVAAPTVTTTQPTIVGKAPPNVTIKIEVHSETQIYQEIVADAEGNFELDIASLSESLEPGEHTVTYSYIDPDTGEEVTETVTFYVAENATAQTQPYGSGNPFPPVASPSPSPSPEPTVEPSPSPSMEATSSAEATDEARVALPATDSAIPVSGSVGTTMALVLGGLFFIIAGTWSFWISSQLKEGTLEV